MSASSRLPVPSGGRKDAGGRGVGGAHARLDRLGRFFTRLAWIASYEQNPDKYETSSISSGEGDTEPASWKKLAQAQKVALQDAKEVVLALKSEVNRMAGFRNDVRVFEREVKRAIRSAVANRKEVALFEAKKQYVEEMSIRYHVEDFAFGFLGGIVYCVLFWLVGWLSGFVSGGEVDEFR